MTAQNLWGDLGGLDNIRSPAVILQEQAALLGKLTNELLEGKVRRHSNPDDNRFEILLYVAAPALGPYRIQILELSYSLEKTYPVMFRDSLDAKFLRVDDEVKLLEKLEELLSSERVRRVLATLISESKMIIGAENL